MMKNGKVPNLLLKHILIFLLFSTLFVISFRLPVFINVNVFFYRGVLLLLILSICMALFLFWEKRNDWLNLKFNYYDIVLSLVIFSCLNLVFFTHLPVTAERSLTVFMLGSMADSSMEFSEDDMKYYFNDKYIEANGNIKKRFEEQEKSGNIKRNGENYVITDKGKRLMTLYQIIAGLFQIPLKNIHP